MELIKADKILVANQVEKDNLHKLGADGRKLLQQMLNKEDFTGLGYGPQYLWTQKSDYLGFIREEVLVSNHENRYPVCIQL